MKLNRPCSIHCVNAHGPLSEFLRKRPKTDQALVALHSFSGKKDMVTTYLKIKHLSKRVYFGFSFAINMRAEKRTRETLAMIPDDKILLETDLDDPRYVDEYIDLIVKVVSEVKGWTIAETIRICNENANRFYHSCLNSQSKHNEDDNENNDNNNDIDSNDELNVNNVNNNDDDNDDDKNLKEIEEIEKKSFESNFKDEEIFICPQCSTPFQHLDDLQVHSLCEHSEE